MTTTELTEDQLIELKSEFVEFKLNEMSHAELKDYVRAMMLLETDPDPEILKDDIDAYDEHLYEILVPYVKDEENSYEILQEYIHERHENDWIDDQKSVHYLLCSGHISTIIRTYTGDNPLDKKQNYTQRENDYEPYGGGH